MATAIGDFALIRDLALVLVTAAITALVFHRLRLPLVLGYLAAGVLVGPAILPLPLVRDPANISVLAQIGVLFLLFSLGLDFHLGKLRKVGGLALTAGTLEVALMIGVGFLVARLFGWGATDALFMGAILAISSTTIILKVLGELGRTRDQSAQAIFGILLVEDLVAVLLIALLSSLALTGAVTAASIVTLVVRVGVFVLATLVIGLVVVPRLVDYVAKLRVEELLVLLAVGIAFAVAMIAVWLELSLALGAFIAGAIVAESRASATVERKIAPLRDVFTAVFFVSTGILLDPAAIVAYWPAILILGAVSILGKIAAVSFATFIAGYPAQKAMRVGIGMAMIGEFSFVIAGLGADLGVTSGFLLPIAVCVSALTTLVTPPLIRRSDAIVHTLGRVAPRGVRGFAAMYSAWLARRQGAKAGLLEDFDAGALLRALTYGAVLIACGVLARVADGWLHATFDARVQSPQVLTLAVFAALVLVTIPMLVGLVRAVRQLVNHLVLVVVPPRAQAGPHGQAAASVLRHTLYVALAVLIALVAVAAGAAFLPPLPLILGGVLLVAIAAFLLRGSLRRLDVQLEQAVDVVFQDAGPGQRDEVLSLLRQRQPWDMHVASLIVPAGSRAAHKRIRELQLTQRTGASIVTHEREGAQQVNPPPDLVILPGDVLGLLGESDQVADAEQFLTSEAPLPPKAHANDLGVEIDEIELDADSPLAGHTLAGSRIRERTGASIVGLRRDGVPILNPAPVMRLQAGDTVMVLGSPSQVAAARDFLRAGG